MIREGGAGEVGKHENKRQHGRYISGAIYNDPVKKSRSLNTRRDSRYSRILLNCLL
jgi:hypothetical protein